MYGNILLCIFRLLLLEKIEKAPEIQAPEHLIRFLVVDISQTERVIIRFDRCVETDRRKILGKHSEVIMILHGVLSFLRLDLVDVCMRVLDRVIFLYNGKGCLRPDSGKPRDIVGGITHQSLHIDKFGRCHADRFGYVRGEIALIGRLTGLCLRNNDFRPVRCDLQKVAVSGYEGDFQPFLLGSSGECPEDIVRFPPCDGNMRNLHTVEKSQDHGHLLVKFRRCSLTCPLVSRILFVAESRLGPVESDNEILRLLLLKNLSKDREEAVDRICVCPVGSCHCERHAVKCTKHDAVSVDQNNFFIHFYPPGLLSRTICMRQHSDPE